MIPLISQHTDDIAEICRCHLQLPNDLQPFFNRSIYTSKLANAENPYFRTSVESIKEPA